MIKRIAAKKVLSLASQFKAVAIIGPRQSGKTTLSKACFPNKPYASLENPEARQFATEDPRGFLAAYPDGAILDEIQRVPELLSWLQGRLDSETRKGTFILTGSNNFLLTEKITQTLAGRVAYLDLLPFSQAELRLGKDSNLEEQLYLGGYPPVRADGIDPSDWFPAYIRTYVERDVRQIKNLDNLSAFERMLSLCAGRIGQLLNYSNLSNELGVDSKTVKSWLGILQASYIVFLLPPYFRNFNKRVLKTPKLYFFDTGLACQLLRVQNPEMLRNHPFRGALFENLIISEMLKNRYNQGKPSNLYFWRDRSGNEIDALLDRGTSAYPVEIKSGRTIQSSFFKGLTYWNVLADQEGGLVYYGGDDQQQRSDRTVVQSWRSIAEEALA